MRSLALFAVSVATFWKVSACLPITKYIENIYNFVALTIDTYFYSLTISFFPMQTVLYFTMEVIGHFSGRITLNSCYLIILQLVCGQLQVH